MLNPGLFTWLDWVFVAIVACSVLLSLWRGFVQEAVSLAGWVAAFLAAGMYSGAAARLLEPYIGNESARMAAAYVILFVAVLMLANICSFVLKQLVRMTGLSVLDRILGTVFGVARGVLVILVGVLLAREFLAADSLRWMDDSQLMPHLELLIQWADALFSRMRFGWLPGQTA